MHLGTWAAVPSGGRDGYSFAGTLYPLCQLATVNPTPYSGHSLRSSAVSTAAVTSIQDSLIYIGQVADLSQSTVHMSPKADFGCHLLPPC